jgi:dihydropteroate synthase-like protein
MRILLPTGTLTESMVRKAAEGMDARVVVTGEIASFLAPAQLRRILADDAYDMVIVSGMCTARFDAVEEETGVPVYRGPRHAADLGMVLSLLGSVTLSRTVPADEYLVEERKKEAYGKLSDREEHAGFDLRIKDLKIGGNSRIKVLAEVMDAPKSGDLRSVVERYFAAGADIVDIGFGFDATPADVVRCFASLASVAGPLAIDTQDPELIRAGIGSVDLILSLHDGNLPEIGAEVAAAGIAAVVVPGEAPLEENIRAARKAGISRIIADPLLQPVGSGLVRSLAGFADPGCPLFFGAGNVVELIDADSVGVNALLAGMAHECGASLIFTSEHSDKTTGSVGEMRRSVEMMALMGDRPYPKDLGVDCLLIKEKRRRREPPLTYHEIRDAVPIPEEIEYDPKGNMRIGIEDGRIVAVHRGTAIRADRWEDLFRTLLAEDRVSLLDHAAYLGKELYKAELALRFGRSFEQDGDF